MVLTAAKEAAEAAVGGLRRMDPSRDLGAIADLIAEAFAREIDDRGRAALREMRWMARLSPLVWWWMQADPGFSDAFNGFVWEEDAPRDGGPGTGQGPFLKGKGPQLVGNVSLNRAPGSRLRWIICNVVVQDAYRRQGIGRQLTEAAIDEARALGAEGVVLQVYEDNLPALRLYTDLGFREVAGETNLRLSAVTQVTPLDASGYRFRAWRPADGPAVQELVRLVTPPVQNWFRPVQHERYRLDWWARLKERFTFLISGRRVYRVAALVERQLVAMMAVTAALRRGTHQLEFLVHPDQFGQVEAALASRVLHMLSAIPSRPARVTVDKDHAAMLQVLREYGFEEQRTLLTLRRDFD
jgi:ribosomal protein S18 acetylase RimI-like enzyme